MARNADNRDEAVWFATERGVSSVAMHMVPGPRVPGPRAAPGAAAVRCFPTVSRAWVGRLQPPLGERPPHALETAREKPAERHLALGVPGGGMPEAARGRPAGEW